jgi:hypothetical protein
MSASAGYLTFSGEDLNDDAVTPLAAVPKSQAAEANFKSNLSSGVATEDFESKAQGASAPLTLDFKDLINGNVTQATLSGGNGSVAVVTPGETNGAGRYSVPSANSSHFWQVNAGSTNSFTVTFSEAIAAFGFYGVDIGDFGGTVSIELTDVNGNVQTLTVPATVGANGSTDGSVLYFGVLSTGSSSDFTSLTFKSTVGGGDVFAFDNFTIATRDQVDPPANVPLPGTLALAGLGLLGLGVRSRRRLG